MLAKTPSTSVLYIGKSGVAPQLFAAEPTIPHVVDKSKTVKYVVTLIVIGTEVLSKTLPEATSNNCRSNS